MTMFNSPVQSPEGMYDDDYDDDGKMAEVPTSPSPFKGTSLRG